MVFFATFVQKIGESVAGQLELQYPTSPLVSERLHSPHNLYNLEH